MTKKAEDEADKLVAKYGTRSPSGTKCAVLTSGQADLINALIVRGVTLARVRTILKDEKGVVVGEGSMQRHRARVCLCDTSVSARHT